ncbi:centromere protein J-like [Eublepharis macularius]|uniref:Centromere protein J-like n=1 Tax=Eublepharis macularius TaxID=481883 RepID=A0AA97IYK1_EUBMA|nr:centromere protein J-like [Eublepharis macularius]
MEGDSLKNKDWVVEGSSGWGLSSPSKTDERVGSSLGLDCANSTNESFSEQFASLHASLNSSILGRDIALSGDMVHTQAFQETNPLSYLATNSLFSHVLPLNHTGISPTCPNNESLGIPSPTAASPPLRSQEVMFCQNREQSLGQPEQLMMRQMEHLQRLVSEQQKIISLYNSGFSVSPGISPHLLAITPSLPRVPAALFPAQLPLENTLPVQNSVCSQVTPLIMKHTLWQGATGTSANGSCTEASRERPEFQATESCLETLPTIKEEKGEQPVCEHTSLSPFGIRINTGTRSVDDRPIRPGIGVRQKTFEEFIEEQLKVDSQRIEDHQKNSYETKVAARKSFLKRGEGAARLEKNKGNNEKEQTKLLRRVSFDCQNHFAGPAHCDAGKLLGKHSQLKKQVSSPTVLFKKVKNTNCITSKDIKCQLNRLEQRPEERKRSSNRGGHDSEEMVNKKEPDIQSQINWVECSHEWQEQIKEIKRQATDDIDISCPGSRDHSDVANNRPTDTKVSVWHQKNLEGSLSQVTEVTEWPINASPSTSELQNLEGNRTNLANKNCRLQVTQAVNDESSEIKVESGPGFKKVNDRIVKVTSKPNRKQAATVVCSQRKQHYSAGAADRWEESPPSSDSVFSSTGSEDEPKSHCSLHPVKPNIHRATKTEHNLDLSDADYATDEPSETEDGKYPAKKFEVQGLADQQEASLITSSSDESSAGVGSLKGRKTRSPLRKSPFHPTKTAKGGKEPETWRKSSASHITECSLQPSTLTRDLVASLFPVFKTKASVEDEKAALEQIKKRPTGELKEWKREAQVQHQDTSLLAQMKDEQAKAMDFLRRQINQIEDIQPQMLHNLEEGKNEEAMELQVKNEEFKKHLVKEEGESVEIKILRQQISELQEEIRRNESHWHAAHGELRSRVEALTKQNLELQDELRVSEHQRLEAERKHGPLDFIERGAEVPALPHLAQNQQKNCGSKLLTGSSLSVFKDTTSSSYKKGKYSSGSSEDSAFLNNPNDDILNSTSLSNEEIQKKENASLISAHRFVKSSEQGTPAINSRRNSIIPSGRKTPAESLPTFETFEAKNSPPKSILSRRAPLYVESKDEDMKEKIEYPDGKVEQLLSDGRRITTFRNGTKKEISADKRTTVLTFFNGDIKKILPDQRVIYYYADAQTTHITYPNGMEVLQFPNHQIEKHHPDGTKEIVFSDQTIKRLYDGGLEETVFPDGTVVKVEKNGAKTILFSNGQKEIHTAQFKRREYPDGTVKTVYANGNQKTKYSSGRVRIKDEKGSLILDRK